MSPEGEARSPRPPPGRKATQSTSAPFRRQPGARFSVHKRNGALPGACHPRLSRAGHDQLSESCGYTGLNDITAHPVNGALRSAVALRLADSNFYPNNLCWPAAISPSIS